MRDDIEEQLSLNDILESHHKESTERADSSHLVKYKELIYKIDVSNTKDHAYQIYIKNIPEAMSEENFSHQQMSPINTIMNNAREVLRKLR